MRSTVFGRAKHRSSMDNLLALSALGDHPVLTCPPLCGRPREVCPTKLGPVSRQATDRGRPHNLDNTSLAVKDVLAGRDRVETKAFEAFRGGYPFRAEFCAPAKGWE